LEKERSRANNTVYYKISIESGRGRYINERSESFSSLNIFPFRRNWESKSCKEKHLRLQLLFLCKTTLGLRGSLE
jgi:hypothetical protein